ncbi:MAG: TIGR01212 family radical SAM protein [Thermodesulfobacteriota bacterium]
MSDKLYNNLSDYFKERFGQKVWKISIYAGLTCPNRDGTKGVGGCVFCEPSSLVWGSYKEGMGVIEQIEAGIEMASRKGKVGKFIAHFQANTNTYAELDYLEGLYREALSHPLVAGLSISTRPDCASDEVLDLLAAIKKDTRLLWLELGLQSSKDSTLEFMKRGHTSRDFFEAVERAASRGIDVVAHIIFGLPGEELSDMIATAEFISSLPVRGVKFHQLDIVRGTPLEAMYERGEVKPLSLEQYVRAVVESIEVLRPDMVVCRLSGDTLKEFLVAPDWGAKKLTIKNRIERLLKERGGFQGKRFRG